MNVNNYSFVVTESGQTIIENDTVTLLNLQDQSVINVRINEEINDALMVHFCINAQSACSSANDVSPRGPSHSHDSCQEIDGVTVAQTGYNKIAPSGSNEKWNRADTLLLISLRKRYSPQFNSNDTKNDAVWNKITADMNAKYTRSQIKDRYQYLRRRYISKKENMGPKSSGAATIRFDYYEEMDDLLGHQPNIEPIALASSSRGSEAYRTRAESCDSNLLESDEEDKPQGSKTEHIQKKRKTAQGKQNAIIEMAKQLQEELVRKREESERRFNENMVSRNRAVDVFAEKMDALIKKL